MFPLLLDALLFAAAFLAGAINAVAGGGTLVTFPALLAAGLPAVAANATSTVALVPGSLSSFWGYRREVEGQGRVVVALALPSVVGGLVGALLVVRLGDVTFGRVVPWLVFGATGLFVAQAWIPRRTRAEEEHFGPARLAALAGYQLLVAVYGGFFGAGIGILMLAALGLAGLSNIHRMNGLKNLAAVCINGVAATAFIVGGHVRWHPALVMIAGGIAGGYAGAALARRLGQALVRRLVPAIGLAMGLYLLLRG